MTTKLHFIALDDTAAQALEMAGLSSRSQKTTVIRDEGSPVIAPGELPVWVLAASGDWSAVAKRIKPDARGLFLFPEPSNPAEIPNKILKTSLTLIPVRLESLATFAFSHTIKSVEMLFNEFHPDDFSLGSEDYFAELPDGVFNRFHHTEGRHLKEAVLRIAHRVRSQRIKEGVAYVLRVPANTALFALDEAIDVLEIAVPPEKPIYFAIRFDKSSNTPVRISALVATPDRPASDLQARIDAAPTYLGKLFVIIDAFAFRQIDEKKMEQLCRENGLEPDDADRLYDYIYTRSDETADLIKGLRSASSKADREEMIAQKLADGFIDAHILEELATLFALNGNAILARAEVLKPK